MLIMGLSLQRGGALGVNNQPSFPESMDCHKGFTLGPVSSLEASPTPGPCPHSLQRSMAFWVWGTMVGAKYDEASYDFAGRTCSHPSPSPICLLGPLPSLRLLLLCYLRSTT